LTPYKWTFVCFLTIQGEIKHMHGAFIHLTLYIAMQVLGATIP